MNEIVKYHNDMNICTNLKGFNKNELNFLMAVCSKMKNQAENEVIFSFEQLEILTQWLGKDKKEFVKTLKNTNKKLLALNFELKTENKIVQFVLFPTFEIDLNKEILTVEVHKKFSFLLNQITNNFTRFELEIFTSLKSKYSQLLYKELMQFKTTGYRIFNLEDFKEKLDIPKTYQMTHIKTKILSPALKELSLFLEDLKLTPKSLGKGKTYTHFEFYFKPIFDDEDSIKKIKEEAIVICEIEEYWKSNFPAVNYTSKHKNIIEKIKKNNSISYIKKYLQEQWEYCLNNDKIIDKKAYFSKLILEEKAVFKDYEELNKKEDFNSEEDKIQAENFVGSLFENIEKSTKRQEQEIKEDIEIEQQALFVKEITKKEYEELYRNYLEKNELKDDEMQKMIFLAMNKNKYKII